MSKDLLAGAPWTCVATSAGAENPYSGAVDAIPAVVPGTVAAALLATGSPIGGRDFDQEDWWYRCAFRLDRLPDHALILRLGGLATIADVWVNGEHRLHSENMFHAHEIELSSLPIQNELILRFAALNNVLAVRRPRPRWKVARLRSQNLRWIRTTLLGRLIGPPATPAPVGPWRAITLLPASASPQVSRLLTTVHKGVCGLEIEVAAIGTDVVVRVDGLDHPLTAPSQPVEIGYEAMEISSRRGERFTGRFEVPQARPWWPHTHGDQPLYPIEVLVDGITYSLPPIGFRSISVDRSDGRFTISVNDVAIFCRGAYWTPLDPIGLGEDPEKLRAALTQVRAGSMNMLRTGGETVYPGDEMLRLCDELGLLLWYDLMFAFADVPAEVHLQQSIECEVRGQLRVLAGHPCVAVISGGSEIDQQAAYYGIPVFDQPADSSTGSSPLAGLTSLVAAGLPGVPFVPSTPIGGALPTDPRTGIAHYFGVGAYLRPPEDARRAAVRFAAECLSFAIPPDRTTVDRVFGGAAMAGHHPRWKDAVYRDAGASWDFEDVREYYVRELFGESRQPLHFSDPERALDLGRATVAELFDSTLSEWRRPASTCAGAIVFHHHDAVPGAGLGMVDSTGRPKSAWYVMRRVMAPTAVVVTDEGLNGLDAHVLNDGPDVLKASLVVELFSGGEMLVEAFDCAVEVPAHGGATVALSGLFGGFRDVNHAHHFGPAPYDVMAVSLFERPAGSDTHNPGAPRLSQAVFTPHPRLLEPDIGLSATTTAGPAEGQWLVRVTTKRFASWVSIDCSDRIPSDSWFHLAPGQTQTVRMDGVGAPRGVVRALNSVATAHISPPVQAL